MSLARLFFGVSEKSMVLMVTNPQTGRKIQFRVNLKGPQTQYQKLEAAGVLKFADVVVENLPLPFEVRPGLVLTRLLAQSNSPLYETNLPGKVAKIGDANFVYLQQEWIWRQRLPPGIAPEFYEIGTISLGGEPVFDFLLMERLDYTLESRRLLLTPQEFSRLVDDTCEIFAVLVNLGLAYNDYKPENVMFSRARNRWLLIDLESLTEFGVQPAPTHTITYTPTSFINLENRRKFEVATTSYTDAESIAYTWYDVLLGLPWNAGTAPAEIVRRRRLWAENLETTSDRRIEFIRWLYVGSQTGGEHPIDWSQIRRTFHDFTEV